MFCGPHFVLSADAHPKFRLGQGRIVRHGRFFGLKVQTCRTWALFWYGCYYGRIRYFKSTCVHVLVINYHRGDRSLIALEGIV